MLEPPAFKEQAVDEEALKDRRRIGRFEIDLDWVRLHPEQVADVFRGLVVFRAEARADTMTIEYSAWSMEFETVPEGVMPPLYEAIVKREVDEHGEESVSVEWRKRPSQMC